MQQTNKNSIAVYHLFVQPNLTKMQEMVLRAYEDGKDHTDHEVADILGIGINRVSGRVGELLRLKKIREATYRTSKFSGIASRACELVQKVEQPAFSFVY